ncbi:hypothetical protein QSH57_003288 [Fusarium oxysporum f. sp. vasinfectum]|nr:hypothetical protein QSH57_003288 [Fusarium oxysporum f. sp. vasinfectum]
MVTQGDSAINLRTSYRMSQDSASIYAITVLAMVFVPGVVLLCCVPSHCLWRHRSHGLALTVYTYNSNLNIDRDYTVVIS